MINTIKEIIATSLALNKVHNLHIYNSMGGFYYFLIFVTYYFVFNNQSIKKFLIIANTVFTAFFFINIISIQGLYTYNSYTKLLGGILVITTALLYFYQILKGKEFLNLVNVPFFWISTGLLFYSVGTIILFGFFEFYKTLPPETGAKLWFINSVLNISSNILITIALFCKPKSLEI